MALHELQRRIEVAIAAADAHMGVAMLHLENGDELALDADESFPMASVLKIPVLVEAARQLDAGKFTLDDRWSLTVDEKNLGSGVLTFLDDGLLPTVRDLLTLMIIISDNTLSVHRYTQYKPNTDLVTTLCKLLKVFGLFRWSWSNGTPSGAPWSTIPT